MKHWFIDTNVLIDFLADRAPFAAAANDIFRAAYAGEVKLYVASLSFSNAFYLIRRSLAANAVPGNASLAAQHLLAKIKPLLTVVAVDDSVVSLALQAGFQDFEDAIQNFAAQSVPAIELLVTRNSKDFRLSSLQIAEPAVALQFLNR